VAEHPISLECYLNSREWNGRYYVELKYAGRPEAAPAPAGQEALGRTHHQPHGTAVNPDAQ